MKKLWRAVICKDKNSNLAELSRMLKLLFAEQNIELEVCSFTRTEDCLRCLEVQRADLVILGMEIGEEDGVGIAREILELNAGFRPDIIFESSHAERVFDVFQVRPFAFVRSQCLEEDMREWIGRYLEKMGGERRQPAGLFVPEKRPFEKGEKPVVPLEGSNSAEGL